MTIKSIERKIRNIEGFNVRILHLDGRDANSKLDGLPSYKYKNAAKNGWTATDWKKERFKHRYPGFKVEILTGDGKSAHGATKLGNIRISY